MHEAIAIHKVDHPSRQAEIMTNDQPTFRRKPFPKCIHRIERAKEAAGRADKDVQLVGVAKYVDATVTAELIAAGCTVLGESRPQQLWEQSSSARACRCPLAHDWPSATQ